MHGILDNRDHPSPRSGEEAPSAENEMMEDADDGGINNHNLN